MSEDAASGAERFAALVEGFGGRPDVTVPSGSARRGFGSTALKVHGSIFAMLRGDQLVVKLPRARVTALLEAGTGQAFDAGKGTPMKDWIALSHAMDEEIWREVTEEAYGFVHRRSRPG